MQAALRPRFTYGCNPTRVLCGCADMATGSNWVSVPCIVCVTLVRAFLTEALD